MALLLAALLTSGCESRVVYLPCPEFEPLTEPPILDLTKIGEIKKITESSWEVTDIALKEQVRFNKECKRRDADFKSTMEAINKFNERLKELND